MARKITLKALIAGAGVGLAIAIAPSLALAGGTGGPGCGCKPPPPPPPPPCNCHQPPNINNYNNNTNNNYNNNNNNNYNNNTNNNTNNNYNNLNVVTNVNVNTQVSNQVALRNSVNVSNTFIGTQTQAQVIGGSSGSASFISPGSVTAVNLGVGGSEREAYESERTRIEKVVIQAFCFDDMQVPHPASQVSPDREIGEGFEGEVYRCIAGAHMQVTIAPWREQISFAGGETLTCHKGEALWHAAGDGGGRLVCRPQIPARDCNERSLLRRFGAGIKVMTLVIREKYTAYREQSAATTTPMAFDGGVGGFAN